MFSFGESFDRKKLGLVKGSPAFKFCWVLVNLRPITVNKQESKFIEIV